ncbi:MAG: hypothetical protein QOF44_5454, partial [Streptomyces sp.]|nr:hypothetical protein [Streptomyces sp.]
MVVPEEVVPEGSVGLFDVARIAVAVLDAQGLIIGWTRSAERLLGYPGKDILGQHALALLNRPEARATALETAKACQAQDGWEGAMAVRHRDGRPLTVAVRVFAVHDAAGRRQWAVLAREAHETPGSELSRMMIAPLLTCSPVGVVVMDTDLRYIWVNDVLTYGGALPRERRLGRRPSEVLPIGHGEALEGELWRVLETGVPVLNYEYVAPLPTDPSRKGAWWTSMFRLEDSAGRVLGVWAMTVDNTDRWRARERLALLTDASAHIGSTLDVVRTAEELAEVSVPRFADVVAVDLLEGVLQGGEPPPGPVGGSPGLRRTAQRSIHPGYADRTGETLRPLPASLEARCLRDGVAMVESLADSTSSRPAEDPAREAQVPAFGIHSVLVVPVRAREAFLGVATFSRSQRPEPFDQDDVSLAGELVARAGVCLDNARRFTRERKAALALQQNLLPRVLPAGTVLDVASRYFPADAPNEVGGDWFDVIPLSGARVALVVGDVVGHGTHAAATMGRLRSAVHTLADLDLPPEELLAHLDDLVSSLVEQEGAEAAGEEHQAVATSLLGATCLYAVYDPVSRRCTLARAGHPPPAIVMADGTVTFPDLPAGPPLGLGFLPFEATELELPDGTLLALYTDGLIEASGQDVDVGMSRLAEALAHPVPTLDDICENVVDALQSGPPRDDAALLIARTHGLDADQVASWDVPADPAAVGE